MEETDQSGIIQVMGKQGADHHVRTDRRRQVEDVLGKIADRGSRRRCSRRHRGRKGIEVEPGQVDCYFPMLGEGGDPAQHVAVPTADVNYHERSCQPMLIEQPLEPAQRDAVRAGPPVDPFQIPQAPLQVRGLAGLSVDEFGRGAAPAQIDHPKPSNIRLSIARPGPNAMAQPGPGTRPASIPFSTNSTVAEDMLP
jgi:hypothetical protein